MNIEVQRNIEKERGENYNLGKESSELKEKNSAIFAALREQTRTHQNFEIEVRQQNLGEAVIASDIESEED